MHVPKIQTGIVILLLIAFNTAIAQTEKPGLLWVNNAYLEHEIYWQSARINANLKYEKFGQMTVGIWNRQCAGMKTRDTTTVIRLYHLLDNPHRDFAANLLLYALFNTPAHFLFDIDAVSWKKYRKQDDILMWTEFLREKGYLKPGDPFVEYVPPVCEDADRPADRRR